MDIHARTVRCDHVSEPQVGLNFAALDVETANGARGSICSFGVVIVRGGKITEKHHLLTVPPGSLNAFAAFNTALHGISHASLVNAPSFASRMAQVLTLVGDLPVVAHNAQFDLGAISDACEEANIDAPQWVYGCTLAMSRKAGLGLKSYSLPVVCAALGVEQGEHHRADDDAQAAANIVLALAGQLNSRSLHSLAAALTVRMAFTRDVEWTPGSQVAARWAAAAPRCSGSER